MRRLEGGLAGLKGAAKNDAFSVETKQLITSNPITSFAYRAGAKGWVATYPLSHSTSDKSYDGMLRNLTVQRLVFISLESLSFINSKRNSKRPSKLSRTTWEAMPETFHIAE